MDVEISMDFQEAVKIVLDFAKDDSRTMDDLIGIEKMAFQIVDDTVYNE
jgi:hypothetical protein